jgi:hypothetical protein
MIAEYIKEYDVGFVIGSPKDVDCTRTKGLAHGFCSRQLKLTWIWALLGVLTFFVGSTSALGGKTLDCYLSGSEYDSLWAIWTATNGSGWAWDTRERNETHWHFPCSYDTPCADSWQGVVCNYTIGISLSDGISKNCTVIGLDLNYYLYGSLPDAIGDLEHLQELTVQNNPYLVSEIPNSIGTITALQKLTLENNTFYGESPVLICSIDAVTYYVIA